MGGEWERDRQEEGVYFVGHFSFYDNDKAIYFEVQQIEPKQSLEIIPRPKRWLPLHSVLGKWPVKNLTIFQVKRQFKLGQYFILSFLFTFECETSFSS